MGYPTVIIPVFNAFDRLCACLGSVQRTASEARVVVIDDYSSDTRIVPWLEQWTNSSKQHVFLRNEANRGFMETANRGICEATGNVVLLNSDTLVTLGWLDALDRCLCSDPDIATATPWTNNGEIVSLPDFCATNPVPDDPDAVARAARLCKTGGYPNLPTAVGFCMAISRTAIDRIGVFDHETFGRGYGEENDFSMRAFDAGMRNVLCDDAYVVHYGGASFGPLGLHPGEDSMQRLLQKHPAYMDRVSGFIQADPLSPLRGVIGNALAAEVP